MHKYEMPARTVLNLFFFAFVFVFLFQWSSTMNQHTMLVKLSGPRMSGAGYGPEIDAEELAALERKARRFAVLAIGSLVLSAIGWGLQWRRSRDASSSNNR